MPFLHDNFNNSWFKSHAWMLHRFALFYQFYVFNCWIQLMSEDQKTRFQKCEKKHLYSFFLKFWYQAVSWLISQNYKITFLVVLHELNDANITECAPQKFVRLKTCKCIIIQVLIDSESHTTYILLRGHP